MAEQRSSCEPFIAGNAHSVDPISPISYVRGLLGRTVRILLSDGHRTFQGILSALDYTGTMAFREVAELTEGHNHEIGVCLIDLRNIQQMELVE
jgi:small nuclear ribonucleoprotein (snRNP)-like protein